MIKSLIIFLCLIITSPIALANRCSVQPNYILDTAILSCKVIVDEDNDNTETVVLNVQVLNEIVFSPRSPINWSELNEKGAMNGKSTLKGEKVPLIFKAGEMSCLSARHYKGTNEKVTFYVAGLCCSVGGAWCPETNYQGFLLPSLRSKHGSPSLAFDPKFDFNEYDIIEEF